MSMQVQGPPMVFDTPAAAIAAMVGRLAPLAVESIPLASATGRVLATAVRADRDSPACDVSAMDGYAVRICDLGPPLLPVTGEALIGRPPLTMPVGAALRIFTGGPVPVGCDAVIAREQVDERNHAIGLPLGLEVKRGQHIRRRGENGQRGATIVEAGTIIDPTVAAALAAFGVSRPTVHQRIRLAVIVTGDEVHAVDAAVEPWQLRDSNGPALEALLAAQPWIHWKRVTHVADDHTRLREVIATAVRDSDALLLTGGVSMGDYDFVPAVLRELDCAVVFHRLPIRPGKPVLGAVGPAGQAVLGLPGNPGSVVTTARRIAAPVLRRLAGCGVPDIATAAVTIVNPDDRTLALHWSRPVRLVGAGRAELVPTRGSGDMISTARSDGFVEIPAGRCGIGPWPFYRWSLTLG